VGQIVTASEVVHVFNFTKLAWGKVSAASGAVPSTPEMATVVDSPLTDFVMSDHGVLTYTGAIPNLVHRVQIQLTSRSQAAFAGDWHYVIWAGADSPRDPFEVQVTQSQFSGYHFINIVDFVTLNSGDVVQLWAKPPEIPVLLDVLGFSFTVAPVADATKPDAKPPAMGTAWLAQENAVNLHLLNSDLAELVTYNGKSISAIFDPLPNEIDMQTGAAIISTDPRLSVRASDLDLPPLEGDDVSARGVQYHVSAVHEVGNDWVDILLHKD
jgi:hypothetical protein